MLITVNAPDNLPHKKIWQRIREVEEALKQEAELIRKEDSAKGTSQIRKSGEEHLSGHSETEGRLAHRQIRPEDYSPLDALIGICETNRPDASAEHDRIILR